MTVTSANKATYVLVHSAFTGPWAMQSVANNLRKEGFKVLTPELPAHGEDKIPAKDVKFSDYVNVVVKVLDKLEEKVILMGHSFAGAIISEVAEQRPEKITSLVYLTAALMPNGTSFYENIKDADSVFTKNLVINEEKGFVTIGNGKTHEAYGEDIPLEAFKAAEPSIVPEPLAPLLHKVYLTNKNFGKVSKYYIETTKDKAVPIELQRKMHSLTSVKKVFTLHTSHAPNLSFPDKVSDILIKIESLEK